MKTIMKTIVKTIMKTIMKTIGRNKSQEQGSVIIFYLLLLIVVASMIAGVATYVSGTGQLESRRRAMVSAQEYAQGGAVIASNELSQAFAAGNFPSSLASLVPGYTLVSSTSQTNVYQRKQPISTPFVNQTVQAQIFVPNSASPTTSQIVAAATVGKVTQNATVNLSMTWGYPAAVISTNAGTNETGISAGVAKDGNVVVNGYSTSSGSGSGSGSAHGPIIVDGEQSDAILANGSVNISPTITSIPAKSVSDDNRGTANAIPDYTAQGTANALFDFNRFIAAADATPNALSASGTNHFTSLASFLQANALAAATPAAALEGIIVVDVTATSSSGKNGDIGIAVLANPTSYVGTSYLPAVNPQIHGITVRGTLFFNFGPAYGPLDKIFNRMPMNINPANLSGLNAADTTTYPSGYPTVYYDPTKNPANVNISSKGFTNFSASEDLPALLYSIGTIDMHGPVDISGVVYTPSYMEIEDKANEGFAISNQIQYIKGAVIVGLGLYFQNVSTGTSIISFDPRTVDSLATLGNSGKIVKVDYWQ